MEFLKSIRLGWIINALAWIVFILTDNHGLEILMGILCLYVVYIGHVQENKNLRNSSIFNAIWMFAWGFGIADGLF
jgi:heme/copper-type cytochrome/quinol oxidase subunit 3